jgi:hypothetical protein
MTTSVSEQVKYIQCLETWKLLKENASKFEEERA